MSESILSVETLQGRLRKELRDAMRTRNPVDIRVIRDLIAAVDNAHAVEFEQKYASHSFTEGSAEVVRKSLSPAELEAVLRREYHERQVAAG